MSSWSLSATFFFAAVFFFFAIFGDRERKFAYILFHPLYLSLPSISLDSPSPRASIPSL
jgi:peptidoglycan/LPS O-acetylase OafA/YrhL